MESVLKECELAIVCPVLNCLEYTQQFIQTIHTKRDYRLIIIDNGSSDGTYAFLKTIESDNQVVVIHFPHNMGVANAWNYGVNTAIENYNSQIFFIPNNDILLRDDTIDIMVDTLKKPEILLVTAYNMNNGKVKPTELTAFTAPYEKGLTEAPDFSCFMIKRETIDKVGYFDDAFYPAYFEDNDYHYRIKMAGYHAVKDNQALYYHFGSMTIKKNEDAKRVSNSFYLQNKEYYRKKWGGYPGEEIYTKPYNQ